MGRSVYIYTHERFSKLLWKSKHPTRKEFKATFVRTSGPQSTQEATNRVIKILVPRYKKADLNEVVANASSLNSDQKQHLLTLKHNLLIIIMISWA